MDELNVLRTTQKKTKSLPFEQYFGEMDLDEKQTEERLLFAMKMSDLLLVVFAYIEIGNMQRAVEVLANGYTEIATEMFEVDNDFADYINRISAEIVDTTVKHLADEYYTSVDRATYIAENEANTTLNLADMKRAVADGKTKKTWVTMEDKYVRNTHREVDSDTIPIDDYFSVGDSLMRYPKDYNGINVTGAEVINCRCTIRYS